MGSPAGAYSNSNASASVYNPTGQSTADQLYQQIAFNTLGSGATNPSTTPAGQAYSTAAPAVSSDIVNNPYYSSLLSAAQSVSGAGQAGYNASQTADASLGSVANTTAQAAANPYTGLSIGGALQGAEIGSQTANQLAGQTGTLTGDAATALAQGYNANQAQYNQTLNNTTQQQAAANAMAGVGSSPYGAGLTDQALNNFNIGWNAQQLQNEATAASTANTLLGAAGTAGTTASNLATSSAAAPAAAVQNYLNNINSTASASNAALSSANAATSGSIANLLAGAGAAYNASNTQGSNTLSALSNLANLGTSQYNLSTEDLAALQNYLGLGQSASTISGNLGALGQQELMNSLGGIGSLFGSS